MDDAIEQAVGQGGIGEASEPVGHRDLGSDEGRKAAEAVIEDFEQVAGFSRGERVTHPVVEDQQVDLGQGGEQGGIRAVAVGLRQLVEQARSAVVTNRMIAAAGSQAECGGDEGFP